MQSQSTQEHWDKIYRSKAPDSVSWYQPHLEQSLAWIESCGLDPYAHIVDVGGGASVLVDDLLAQGFKHISVADISGEALAHSRTRLGHRANAVKWVVGDITTTLFDEGSVDLWHDRAVFHFLIDAAQRDAYIEALRRCVRPGGFAIMATFGPQGPERCSDLPVKRYTPGGIAAVLGDSFELVDQAEEAHTTPQGTPQTFAYALCRRIA